MTNEGQPPIAPAPQTHVSRPSGAWQLAVGIVLVFLSMFSLPRGIVGIIVTSTQPGMVSPGYAFGVAAFGAMLFVPGILLLVRSVKIMAANRAAFAAEAAAAVPPPYPTPPAPPAA